MVEYLFYTVSLEEQGKRLDKFLLEKLKPRGISRQHIINCIKEYGCKVNDRVCKKPSFIVRYEDKIELTIDLPRTELSPVKGNIDIVWRDDHLIIINKPSGISVHPASLKDKDTTLVNLIISKFPEIKDLDVIRPGIVHRLDKDTSGLMVIALNAKSQKLLVRKLANREISKKYLAIVSGIPELLCGEINKPIMRSKRDRKKMEVMVGGKESRTYYEVVHVFEDKRVSLVKVNLLTGRTHQIRVHFSSIGCSVLGDDVYGKAEFNRFKRQYPMVSRLISRQLLHSWKLSFSHPLSKEELFFVQPVPKDFLRAILGLFKRVQRVGITGNLGCGKSMLVDFLKMFGAKVWSADEEVKKLYKPKNPGWEAIVHFWGDKFFDARGNEIDKRKLFEHMLKDSGFRKELEKLIHPMIENSLVKFFDSNREERVAVAEVPLLIEVGWKRKDLFDVVVGVYCKDELRHKWLMEKRGIELEKVRILESWQMPQKEKMRCVDIVIENPGNKQEYKDVALKLWNVLKSLRINKIKRFLQRLKELNIVDSSF